MVIRSENRVDANRGLWLMFLSLAILSLNLFRIPAFGIRPFRPQSENALGLAIAVKRIAPALTIAASAAVLALGWQLWRSSSRVLRAGIVIALVLSAASAVMVRQNYFEWMFRPIKAAGLDRKSTRLDSSHPVISYAVFFLKKKQPVSTDRLTQPDTGQDCG